MSERIRLLKIPDENYRFVDEKNQRIDQVQNLSKINIFVGENNSGKSRLLRNILSNEITWIPFFFSLDEWNETIEKIHNEMKDYFKKIDWTPQEQLVAKINPLKNIKFCNKSGKFSVKYNDFLNYIDVSYIKRSDTRTGNRGIPYPDVGKEILKIVTENTKKFGIGFEKNLEDPASKKIYIPILRGLLPINSPTPTIFDQQDVYQTRVLKDYFDGKLGEFEIFTGLNTFQQLKDYKLGIDSERKKIEEYEKFLSKNFFENKQVTLTPYEKTSSILIKIGDESSREIFNLGDGLQTIVILTLPLFLNLGEKMLVFIEEPEKLLHPGFQRKLIETLLNQPGFENFQYFMTTHSNHFLDITLDFTQISIYSVRKEFDEGKSDSKTPHFLVENLSNGNSCSLELLGVRNSSVFLSNCTIWVEGITDRKYFRKFLEMYERKNGNVFPFKEDLHYSFVEYGGSNITHWSFLDNDTESINVDRLCGKLLLIADNPGKQAKKQQRHEQLRKKLGEKRFIELRCKEVENLLLPKTIKCVLASYGESIESIREFKHKEYFDKPLGEFLENLFKTVKKNRKGSYSDENTISEKVKFCEIATNSIETWDDLSKEAQDITEMIATFIRENNS